MTARVDQRQVFMKHGTGLTIVGSGPAGLAAARAYREHGGDRPVTMITADGHPPYARPPLTKDYLRGESDVDDLWLVPKKWFHDNDVSLRLGETAADLDAASRLLLLADGREIGYLDLVLATGSSPTPLPVEGGDQPGLIYVRDRVSGDRLREVAEHPAGRVAVIGSGFIGCEAAASLATRGIETVLVSNEELPHARRLGAAAGTRIQRWLNDTGVELRTGAALAAIERNHSGWRLRLEDDTTLAAAQVVCGGGAAPNLGLATLAGLAIENGGVRADASLRSSDPSVRVAGDIAYAYNTAAGRHLRVEHWGDAETHGEIAGGGVAGQHRTWNAAPGFWSTIGDRTCKYSSWGDGWDDYQVIGDDDSWVIWYRSGDAVCGVLTHENDDEYERGQELLSRAAPFADAVEGRHR
jgi:NADPH-dependent 2,4-dienoyl-CoA reductase/sulfur reductase-like enzyme